MDEEFSAGSVDADREMTRLWRTWRTVFEMLHDRVCAFHRVSNTANSTQGYEVTEDEVQMPLEDFKAKYAGPVGYPEYASPAPSAQHPSI